MKVYCVLTGMSDENQEGLEAVYAKREDAVKWLESQGFWPIDVNWRRDQTIWKMRDEEEGLWWSAVINEMTLQ